MKREELIEALMKFAEQTGVDWFELDEMEMASNQVCVVFEIEVEDES